MGSVVFDLSMFLQIGLIYFDFYSLYFNGFYDFYGNCFYLSEILNFGTPYSAIFFFL